MAAGVGQGAVHTWKGGSGLWDDDAKWTNGVPSEGADVVIATGTVFLTNVTARLNSLEMKGGTLFFSNSWDACVVASDIWIRGAATVRHQTNYASTTNAFGEWPVNSRIYFVCTNFFLSGTINADVSGWVSRVGTYPAAGPGGGRDSRAGAGYGGYGGNAADGGGDPYGSITEPSLPGSAGAYDGGTAAGGTGGGAVRIESHGGTVVVNGTISANGNIGGSIRGGGSGGSIWISCRVFAATGGTIRAIGGDTGYSGGSGAGGSGGRIAIHYDPVAQASAPPVDIRLLASRGALYSGYTADLGSIYLPDAQLLPEVITGVEGQIYGPTSWTPNSLVVSNVRVRFAEKHFVLSVSNHIVVIGSNGRLEMGGGSLLDRSLGGYLSYTPEMQGEGSGTTMLGRVVYSEASSILRCGGDLIVTNGAFLRVFSGPTNDAVPIGALVEVGGDIRVYHTSWILPVSNPTNGGSPLFRAQNIIVGLPPTGTNCGFWAVQGGFRGGGGNRQKGYGPGGGGDQGGGGYGGRGGHPTTGGPAYGVSNAPVHCGSGGGREGTTTRYAYAGGSGGGLIWLEITNRLVLYGQLNATGGIGTDPDGGARRPGAGAGGGIWVQCRRIEGTGAFWADGGRARTTYTCGSGGGGRIAVIGPKRADFGGTLSAQGGRAKTGYEGDAGTIYWEERPAMTGTIISIR